MSIFTKDINTMDELFVHALRDIYYADNRFVEALPDMIKRASNPQLKQAFRSHLGETETQVLRLQEVFRMYGAEVKGIDCPAFDGLIEEADDVADEVEDRKVLDTALIAAAQAVEHYQIARYGSLIAWAKELGRNDCANILEKNLAEAKAADRKLTVMAESGVNTAAAAV
jgi:ferritin-like metal-binding protein YciE